MLAQRVMADPVPTFADRPWGVAALLLAAADALQARLAAVTVQGELSNFTRAASGHCYFNLKDADGASALLRCAMFRRAAALVEFSPQDGQQVELRGRIGVYEPRGELQLVVESMQRLGAGSLYELFLRLKAKLESEGLFAPERKRVLPAWPRAVGVVTSRVGAALHDVLTALARRAPHLRVVVYPSAVQGPEAPAQLAQAIGLASLRREVDLLIVCRGGGSIEDLWAFNDERVVRAITGSLLPVVCGVGHETDVTLADLAADLRAPTPTAAAELAAPRRDEALAQLATLADRLQRASRRLLDRHAQRLDNLALRAGRPAERLARQGERLTALRDRAASAMHHALALRRSALAEQARRLPRATQALWQRHQDRHARAADRIDALDPARVLARGYAWVTDAEGRAITRAAQLAPGQQVDAVWADGRARVTVDEVQPR
jgi:exodeoxyribonuclease VII large subunit